MKEIIKSVFSGSPDSLSSKRVIMFMLVLTFLIVVFVNLFNGKSLSTTLSEQLFYLVIYSLAAVFGEQITDAFKKKSDKVDPEK